MIGAGAVTVGRKGWFSLKYPPGPAKYPKKTRAGLTFSQL